MGPASENLHIRRHRDYSITSSAPFLALIKSEIDRWSPIIKAAGVQMN